MILFDRDGVIVDSIPEVLFAYRTMVRELELPVPPALESVDAFRAHNEADWRKNYEVCGIPPEHHQQASEIFRRVMTSRASALYDGIEAMLRELAGQRTLALVSGNHQDVVEEHLASLELLDVFVDVRGYRQGDPPVSKTEVFRAMLSARGVDPADAVVVGDMDHDFAAANAVGIGHVVACEFGFVEAGKLRAQVRSQDLRVDRFVATPRELADHLGSLE